MKKLLSLFVAVIAMVSLTACGNNNGAAVEKTNETQPTKEPEAAPELKDWDYDASTHTLYVNADMGAFEADAPDSDGTSSNAPWAEFLPEIENIVVGDDVTVIGDYAFAFCPNLKNVEVGKNVTALDFRCFFMCGDFGNGSNIDMHFNSTPSYGDDVFGWTWENPNVVIHVPDDMKEYWAGYIMQKGAMNLDGYDLQRPEQQGQQEPSMREQILFSMLMNPREVWYEGSGGFADNDCGQFGGGDKGYNAEMQRMEIYGGETGQCIKFNTSLKNCMAEAGMDPMPQQAVMVRFSASDISNGARISFDALDEIDFWFGDDGVKFVDVARFFETPITDFMPNKLVFKDDTIYCFFFAFSSDGFIRMFIWEEESVQNQGYFVYDLYQETADIDAADLIMHLAIGANAQFNLYEYWVYTFDSFMDGTPPFVIISDGQNNDYGPQWTVNIAGNFDIYSDLVWQSVECRAFEINGDTYVGYNLADMMNFSGNGQDNAKIVFGQQGADSVEVNPTSQASIVFKKNDEFLGGPYLLWDNKMYEYPVIEVKTDN